MPTLIDPEQIYPKRLGMYKGALVIQYYNLQKDCFKKHLIPYDSSQSTDKILQSILKNPNHSAFLRKVSPNYLRQAISGKTIILPSEINEKSSQNQFSSHHPSRDSGSYYTGSDSNKSSSQNRGNSYNTNSYTGSNSQYPSSEINDNWKKKTHKTKEMDNSQSYVSSGKDKSKEKNRIDSSPNLEQSHGYSMNFDEESMNISVVPVKQIAKNSHIIEQQIDYKQDFEELSAQKLDVENEKLKQKQRQREKQKQKQKEKQQKKEQKKEKKKKQKQLDEFQFLDDEQPKKKKKKKKDKEKSKDKQSKSKNKESNSSENPSKQASVREQIPIEEEFDFI